VVSAEEALQFFDRFPWATQVELFSQINSEDLYHPLTICFNHVANGRSLDTIADTDRQPFGLSRWYVGPVRTKLLFGLLGEKEKTKFVDRWDLDLDTTRSHLGTFLEEKYDLLESVMRP